ncbi:MAG: L-2-hydroxyglutarate oxidase [Solirubrobacteraceae bacterium]
MRVVVVGGGILGLATARLIACERPDAEVVLLEKEAELARHQTGHNSGVAHAGLYYPPGSLKARLCRRGLGLLRAFCEERALGWDACGKLVVATCEPEIEPLRRLQERAHENGVAGLRWLDGAGLTEIEPHVRGVAALHCTETATVDFVTVAHALAADAREHGGEIRTGAEVAAVGRNGSGPLVRLASGAVLGADRVIVCAGLQADRLARASGQSASPRIVPFRGEYWQLRPARRELVRGLIYPVPDPALPFLGVHLTRKLDGSVWIGPNAILSLAREGYRWRDARLRDLYESVAWPGTWRMARRHWRAGIAELQRSARKRAFVADAARYVPDLTAADVVRAPAGIRAQAVDPDGALVDDFRLVVADGVTWVRNAPSPAATSSLAIAEELAERAF